jgi:hypothetical protein
VYCNQRRIQDFQLDGVYVLAWKILVLEETNYFCTVLFILFKYKNREILELVGNLDGPQTPRQYVHPI